jgi:hypothetical protein
LAALAALGLGCPPAQVARGTPLPARSVPQEIVVRTSAFVFQMGGRADATWPLHADRTYEALARETSVLLTEEDALVPLVAQQLGFSWPPEPLDFDVVLAESGGGGPCAGALASRVDLDADHPEPVGFFACVLRRGIARVASKSAVAQAIERVRDGAPEPARDATAGLYGCISAYAVTSVLVVRVPGSARVLAAPLEQACTRPALAWVSRRWLSRVRDEVTPESFGEEAARTVGVP